MPSLHASLLCCAALLRGAAACHCEGFKGQAPTLVELCGKSGSGMPMGAVTDCIPTHAYRLQAGGDYVFTQTAGNVSPPPAARTRVLGPEAALRRRAVPSGRELRRA
jgi:hypothetical protein